VLVIHEPPLLENSMTPSQHIHTSPAFFALRSLSPSTTEIHLVGGPDRYVATLTELTAFVRSCLEVLGPGEIEITRLGEDQARWRGIRVGVDAALLDVIARQVCPRLHDTIAGWVQHLHPHVDVVWKPR
jgi:hypothetical protein